MDSDRNSKVTFFAYFDISNPAVAWEVAIGRIKSICDITENGFGVSLWKYNIIAEYSKSGLNNKFVNELKLEQIRQSKFQDKVSRLQGVYFFRTEDDAHNAINRWGLQRRKSLIVSEVDFYPRNLTELDSEWITSCLLTSNGTEWMSRYWSGETYGVKPLTEILASGIGFIKNKDLRSAAYKRIFDLWPESTALLASSACAFSVCGIEEVCMVIPALLLEKEQLKGGYFIRMKEFDELQPDIVEAVKYCKKTGQFPVVVCPKDSNVIFRLPDMSKYSFEFHINKSKRLFTSVHHGYIHANDWIVP